LDLPPLPVRPDREPGMEDPPPPRAGQRLHHRCPGAGRSLPPLPRGAGPAGDWIPPRPDPPPQGGARSRPPGAGGGRPRNSHGRRDGLAPLTGPFMAYKASKNPTTDIREWLYVPELLRGLAITTRHFLRNLFNPRDTNVQVQDREGANLVSTVSYPEETPPCPAGYRGLHRLVPREDGKPRCVACYMCATICPAQCIYIEAGEYESTDPSGESRVIEKYPTQFVIDELRCIVCGF